MSDCIQFEHVQKDYRIGQRHTSLRAALVAAAARSVGRGRSRSTFRALSDVTFSVAEGESVAVIGRNGSGKSTALKVLAHITSPSSGLCRTRGRVAALLEVGTGFHNELTGRQNIYLNGAILGMSRRDISARFDSIVEFAGVSEFIDTPVKRYSSGMYLRLAFSIAAHVEPEILVVDEILAVGDSEFQQRCIGRLSAAVEEGRTVVFVSHDMNAVSRLCSRTLWLDQGRLRGDGRTNDVVRSYMSSSNGDGDPTRTASVTVWPARVGAAAGGAPGTAFLRSDELRVTVRFDVDSPLQGLEFAIYVSRADGVRILDEGADDDEIRTLQPGSYEACLTVPAFLNVGEYAVGVWFQSAGDVPYDDPVSTRFRVEGDLRVRPERVLALDVPVSVRWIDADDAVRGR